MDYDNNKHHSKPAWVVAIGSVFVLYLFLCYTTYSTFVNVPYWDQWQFVPLLDQWHQGTLTLENLFAQKNQHRSAVPRAVWLVMADLSHWNHLWEVTLNLATGLGSFLLLLLIGKRTCREQDVDFSPWLLVLFALPFFSLAQQENWMWGWQWQLLLCVFWLLAGISLLQKGSTPGFWGACVIGVLSTYTFANGMIYWFALLPLLLCQPERKPRLLIWSAFALLSIGLYLWGYQQPRGPSVLAGIFHPLYLIWFFFVWLGSLAGHLYNGGNLIPGLTGIAGFAIWTYSFLRLKKHTPKAVFATVMALSLFALLSAGMISAGRVGKSINLAIMGVDEPFRNAMASRYTTFSLLFWVVLLLQIQLLMGRELLQKKVGIPILAVIGSAILVVSLSHQEGFEAQQQRLATGQKAILENNFSGNEIRKIIWKPALVEQRAPVLKKYRSSLFREQ